MKQSSRGVLRNFAKFTGKHLCQSLFFNSCKPETCNFTKKETLAHVFCCEFCKIPRNTFLHKTPLVAAYEWIRIGCKLANFTKTEERCVHAKLTKYF